MAAKKPRGGAPFEELCNVGLKDVSDKTKNYSFNLTSLKEVTDKKAAVTKVEQQINATLEALTGPERKKTVEKYTIGKTSGHSMRDSTVDSAKPMTIGKTHISKRWQLHKREGKDGMVLVAAVTETEAKAMKFEDDLGYKDDSKKGSTNAAEKCALHLEEHLQKKFEDDGRLDNSKDYRPGPLAPDADIYLVYIAYKYSRQRTVRPSQQQATPQLTQQLIQQLTPKPNPNAYYTFNLADLSKASDKARAVKIVHKRIEDTQEDLKASTGKDIQVFFDYTHVDQRDGCDQNDDHVFDHMDPSTFDKGEIQRAWAEKKKEGMDGMMVVAVITKQIAEDLGFRDAPQSAEYIKEELCTKYVAQDTDESEKACCLYITFKLKERQRRQQSQES